MFPAHNPYCSILNLVALLDGCNLELHFHEEPEIGRISCSACTSKTKVLEYWLAGLKLEVHNLRRKLKSSFAHVNYTDRYVRAAYMLTYFPFYIEPIYSVIINHIKKIHLLNQVELNVIFIGGGPLPELLGLSQAISERKENVEKINANVLDAVPHWASERRIITEAMLGNYWDKKFAITSQEYDLFNLQKEAPSIVKKGDLVIVQNCINDCPQGSIPNIEVNIKKIWLSMRKRAVIILLDLNYLIISGLIKNLQKFFLSNGGSLIQPITLAKNYRPNIPFCDHLETKLYEPGVDGLIAKRNVNYYSLMAQRN